VINKEATMAATTTPILAKIKKLLALSEGNGTTEAEASLAAEHVQRMLQDHGLTLAQVEAAGGGSDETTKRDKILTDRAAIHPHHNLTMAALAENNFCLHMVQTTFRPDDRGNKRRNGILGWNTKRHLLVGRDMNVQATLMMYDYLIEAMDRCAAYAGHIKRSKDRSFFLEGAASRIAERLSQRRREREEESTCAAANATTHAGNGTHTELVLSDVYGTEADLNNDTLNGFPAGTTAAERRKTEARRNAQTAEHDRLVAEGVDSNVAWYRAYGYSEERAVEAAKSFARSSRGRGGRGRTRNWTRGDDAHYAKINSPSYKAGRVAGANIGLDDQVGATKRKQIGEG